MRWLWALCETFSLEPGWLWKRIHAGHDINWHITIGKNDIGADGWYCRDCKSAR